VTDDASVAAALAQIEADGGLDVLVNNAGIGMLALNGPDALRVFDTNAVGIIRVTETALPAPAEVAESCRRERLERARLVLGQP
jgi:NAD(P)-dependent dehydrogenase (short-subunit alcohol dehydrogenase family)